MESRAEAALAYGASAWPPSYANSMGDESARPPSPTESLASISSIQFEVGSLPAPLMLLMEQHEQAESLGEYFPEPTELDLSGCASLTDVLVCEVLCERFCKLRKLLLAQCLRLSEPAFLAIGAKLGELAELDLSSCAVSDAAMLQLVAGCPRLRTLTLRSCRQLTNAGLATLPKLSLLAALDISSSKGVTDAGLAGIAHGCPLLSVLSIAQCTKAAKSSGVGEWALGFAALASLNVSATLVDDAAANAIASVVRPSLTSINLSRTQAGDSGVEALVRSSACALTCLFLAGCTRVSDSTLNMMPSIAPALRELHLTGCSLVSDDGLCVLAEGCHDLEVLVVDHCNVTDTGVAGVAERCAQLRVLQASGVAGVGDPSVVALAQHCERLQRADLRGCANVTEASVMVLEKSLPECKLLVNGLLRNIW